MATTPNKGYDPAEIKQLEEECRKEGSSFVYVEDEEDEQELLNSGECVHILFVGTYQSKPVIYDAIIFTLRLHHSSLVYEMAMESVRKSFPQYVSPEERQPGYKIDAALEDEIELYLTEMIEEIEETEAIKVQEHVETDYDFEYGISLEVCLNVEELTDEVVEAFVHDFNNDTLVLDQTLYSFTSDEEQ